jgi:hypothetical protein
MNNIKRDNWFVNYQEHRDLNNRIPYLNKSDFENASVMDIGCNAGQLCRYVSDCGANYVFGIDYDKSAIKKARELSTKYDIDFSTDDIDNFIFYNNLPDFDVCLLLSVIGTQELTNRYGMLAKISTKTKNVLYIEGHQSVFKKKELFESILNYTTFTSIEYLGKTYDNDICKKKNISRDMFRCSRKIYTHHETINKFVDLLNQNDSKLIAVYGHGGIGKSTLKKHLIEYLNDKTQYKFDVNSINTKGINVDYSNTICILDDIPYADIIKLKKVYKFIIYFDYRVLEYTQKHMIDTLFIMKYNIKKRYQNRPQYVHHRSPSITHPFIKNIYHIEPY